MRKVMGVPFALSLIFISLWALSFNQKSDSYSLLFQGTERTYAGLDKQLNTKATPVSSFLYCVEESMQDEVMMYNLPQNAYGYAVTSSTISSSYPCNVTNVDTYLDEVYPGEGTGWLRAGDAGELRFKGCPCIGIIGYGR